MIQTNAEKNIVGKIFILLIILLSIICGTNKVQAVSSKTTIQNNETVQSSKYESELDIENKEDVQETITNYILTINTEGLTQSILSDVIELYSDLTEVYSNEQISDMLDNCKGKLSQYGVNEENLLYSFVGCIVGYGFGNRGFLRTLLSRKNL